MDYLQQLSLLLSDIPSVPQLLNLFQLRLGICSGIILLFALFTSPQSLKAEGQFRFRTLSPEGGFYYDGVNDIEQDSEGFVWIVMDYELYRFDGYTYKKYYPQFASMDPTKRWIFRDLASDTKGNLFVNTSNGVYRYDSRLDCFERLCDEVSRLKMDALDRLWVRQNNRFGRVDLKSGEIFFPDYEPFNDESKSAQQEDAHQKLAESAKDKSKVSQPKVAASAQPLVPQGICNDLCSCGKKLFSFAQRTIYRFDETSQQFVPLMQLPLLAENEADSAQRGSKGKLMLQRSQGSLILEGTDESLLSRGSKGNKDSKGNQLSQGKKGNQLAQKSGNPGQGRDRGNVIRFAQEHNEKLWVYVEREGVYVISLNSYMIEAHYPMLSECERYRLRQFYVDGSGQIWLGTINGLYIFNSLNQETTRYSHSATDETSLPNNSIWRIYEDRQGNVWIGTYSGKLCYVDMDSGNAFRSYFVESQGLNYAPVSAFAEDKEGVWIGTEGGGVNRVEKRTRTFSLLNGQAAGFDRVAATDRSNGRSGMPANIKSLAADAHRHLWVSTYRNGIYRLDEKQRVVDHLICRPEEKELLVNDVRKILLEGDSGVWIAYQLPAPRISYYSIREKSIRHIRLDKAGNYDYLFDIIRQGEHTLWAISNEALYRLDIRTGEVRKMVPENNHYLGLFTFCADDEETLWIGTIGHGLLKFDTHTLRFLPLSGETLRREIYSIYSICHSEGQVWMGTDNGLFCYQITTGRLHKFDQQENTQGQVYYPLAVMKGSEGKIYFGGTKGFTVVNPARISTHSYLPKAMVSEFFVNHEAVAPRYADNVDDEGSAVILLRHDESNFGFEFSADNYRIPEKNRFRYRLKGYNKEWIMVDARQRRVMYAKVPAGRYQFEVCASNNDGVWGPPTVIRVVRRTAPWASLPAYIGYLLVLAGIAWFVIRHYTEKRHLKMLLYQENLEREKKEQIHQEQLRFFTNISHDFRTPLSLILAALDKLRREGLKEYYYRILNGNVQRLLDLVNELMEFQTVENGMMKLRIEPVNVNSFVQEIAHDFSDYAIQRQIDFRIECDESMPSTLMADKKVVEKIVMKLLNNAFKYTRMGGTIVLKVVKGEQFTSSWSGCYSVGDCIENAFSIVVSDTGVGISSESIGSVFDRFYKVNTVNMDSHLGTGIGLALVKSLVLLHKGCITIYSEREKGTDMVVNLPVDSRVFAEEDFVRHSPETAPTANISVGVESTAAEGASAAVQSTAAEGASVAVQSTAAASSSVAVQSTAAVQSSAAASSSSAAPSLSDGVGGTVSSVPRLLPQSARKILIVEDNKDLRELIAESLSEEFFVTGAGDGIEALKLMEDTDFDLVISDIMMPRKDGVSLCNDIKNNVNTSHIPVVLLTAKSGLESRIEGVDSGADLYFEKPMDLTYLRLSIQNIFRNRQQLKEHYAKNYYADSGELATNEQDNKFLKQLTTYIDEHIDQSDMDVNQIAEQLSMSRSKLYTKVKSLTGKSVVEFVLNCRLRKAAKLIIEENMTMKEVMFQVGIESQAYFTNAFKKVFGETPTSFANKHRPKE